jgi:hypothetical protein
LKLFQNGERRDKGEWWWWWGGWIQLWYIWYIVRTFINATVYSYPGQQLEKNVKPYLKNHWKKKKKKEQPSNNKWTGGMTQVVKHLSSKYEALISNPSTTNK